jgi:DnaJ like chaperone protein
VSKYGAWIGGAIGWALGGPIGGLLGFAFGKMFTDDSFESGTMPPPPASGTGRRSRGEQRHSKPGDFAAALLVLSAAVMKADEQVMRSELDFVKQFLKTNFGAQQAEQLVRMLREILGKPIAVREVAEQVRFHMEHPKRLLLLQYLYGIAQADGHVHSKEIEIIRRIAGWLDISAKDQQSIEEMFVKSGDADPYKVLEIDKDASDVEVKKAYRRLAVKFHPDKVQDLGEQHQAQAKERFIRIQAAYERIKKERNLK